MFVSLNMLQMSLPLLGLRYLQRPLPKCFRHSDSVRVALKKYGSMRTLRRNVYRSLLACALNVSPYTHE